MTGTADTSAGIDDSGQLIAALQSPPRRPSGLVSRTRLLSRLDDAAMGPITLVSGEPAAGKTSLVIDWLEDGGADQPAAWVTIRSSLDDPITFWRYLLAAVGPLDVEIEDLRLALEDQPPGDRWLTALANRLAAVPGDTVVVLDDLHAITTSQVLDALFVLLDRIATNTHVVLITRSEPPWALSRWRMSGRLAEIDSRDLRFTLVEVGDLVASAGIDLDDDDVTSLLERTEGWAGALRLAMLSMQHSDDPGAFVARFAAEDELVSSYLFREVLAKQPDDIREFLLDVAILDELTTEVCDRLRARDDSAELLERCRSANLFITELAVPSATYRLHGLVAQLLVARLGIDDPDRLRELHLRASEVFEESRDVSAAITHAAATDDVARVGELVSAFAGDAAHQGRFDDIRSWLALLRRDTTIKIPEVELGLAITLGICGSTKMALEQVEHLEDGDISPEVRYAAEQARGVALMLGGRLDELADVASWLDAQASALHDATLPFEPVRAATHWTGVSALMAGELAEARRALERSVERVSDPDVHYVDSMGFLARVAYAEGDIDEAERCARECIARNAELAGGETSAVTTGLVTLADVAWERNELDRSDSYLADARRSIRPVLWEAVVVQMSTSRLLASRGELGDARQQLVECGQTYLDSRSSASLRAMLSEQSVELALRGGDVDGARRWERSFAADANRPLAPALQIRLAAATDAENLAEVIGLALATRPVVTERIDTLLAAAHAFGEKGDERRSAELVGEATELAEPYGLIRRLLDAGSVVQDALRRLQSSARDGDISTASPFFLDRLGAQGASGGGVPHQPLPERGTLVEPLTTREIQVLELLIAGRSYSEIGVELFVSRNTVKSHASHIYTKLGVSGRADAAVVARRLQLV